MESPALADCKGSRAILLRRCVPVFAVGAAGMHPCHAGPDRCSAQQPTRDDPRAEQLRWQSDSSTRCRRTVCHRDGPLLARTRFWSRRPAAISSVKRGIEASVWRAPKGAASAVARTPPNRPAPAPLRIVRKDPDDLEPRSRCAPDWQQEMAQQSTQALRSACHSTVCSPDRSAHAHQRGRNVILERNSHDPSPRLRRS